MIMDKYNISTKDQYDSIYKDSINDPEGFWSEIALKNFSWKSKWENVLEWNSSADSLKSQPSRLQSITSY